MIITLLEGLSQHKEVRAVRGMPELDGAPGGTLGSYGIAADNMTIPLLSKAVAYHPSICFVPTISAVSVLDISEENLKRKANELRDQTSLDDFLCSSEKNTEHSEMTRSWASGCWSGCRVEGERGCSCCAIRSGMGAASPPLLRRSTALEITPGPPGEGDFCAVALS